MKLGFFQINSIFTLLHRSKFDILAQYLLKKLIDFREKLATRLQHFANLIFVEFQKFS